MCVSYLQFSDFTVEGVIKNEGRLCIWYMGNDSWNGRYLLMLILLFDRSVNEPLQTRFLTHM